MQNKEQISCIIEGLKLMIVLSQNPSYDQQYNLVKNMMQEYSYSIEFLKIFESNSPIFDKNDSTENIFNSIHKYMYNNCNNTNESKFQKEIQAFQDYLIVSNKNESTYTKYIYNATPQNDYHSKI